MSNAASAAAVDWSKFRLTRLRVFVLALILFMTALGVSIVQFSTAKGIVLPAGGTIGGDYIAFDTAAKAILDGETAEIYVEDFFEQRLHDNGFPAERSGLTWQYPPTYYFAVLPLAFLAFVPGYIFWSGGTALAYFGAMRAIGFDKLFLFVILASPVTFHAIITGQNGFISATLLAVAAYYPDKRPIVAGIAAALMSVKPQFGFLLPIAFLAGGCWRAFFVAATGTISLGVGSVVAFGLETWPAFFESAKVIAHNLVIGRLPLYKMTTTFTAVRLLDWPPIAAQILQASTAIAAALAVGVVWRRVKDADLRAAALLACVFMTTPYGYYYELVILALPIALLVRRGMEQGWMRGEQALLVGVYMLPMFMPGDAKRLGLSLGFAIVLLAVFCVFRRIAHDYPHTFRLASRPAPSGAPA